MTTLNLISFASVLHDDGTVQKAHEPLLSALREHFTLNIVDCREAASLGEDDFRIVFIGTGGVEGLVVEHFEQLPAPAVILADGMQNSLAASLEIAAWLRTKGVGSEILHGEFADIIERIKVLHRNFRAMRSLAGMRVGVIGTPSSWLIASNVDYASAREKWGVEFVDVALERVFEEYERVDSAEVGEPSAAFVAKAAAIREASPEDITKAMRLYAAIRNICEKERLDALTLSCFSLLDRTKTTGCLALALLNDEGIVAGCEGDIQTVFTLLAAKAVTGVTGFMANPSKMDPQTGQIVFAHCTVGLSQTESYVVRNHFESNTGVGIQGILPLGAITVLRCGGSGLGDYYLSTGTLTENTDYVNMCRTQVRVALDTPVDYFLTNPLGNHHVLLHGNHARVLDAFFRANACRRVE